MNSRIEKNEIDDILNTILDYKKLIIGIVIIFVLIASFYAFFIQKAIYKGSVIIKIAQNNTHIIEDEESLVQILKSKYQVNNREKSMPFISNILKPRYSKGIVQIYADGHNKSSIEKLLRETAIELGKEHNLSVQIYIKDQKRIILNTE